MAKDNGMTNVSEVIAKLSDVFVALEKGIIPEKRASELNNGAGKIIKGALGQLEYNFLTTKNPKMKKIKFFENAE